MPDIVMLETRSGEDGNPWKKGNTYPASLAFAKDMIGRGFAYAADYSLPDVGLTATQVAATQALVSGARNRTGVLAGDSHFSNGWGQTGSPVTFTAIRSESWFTWFNALLGAPLRIIGCTAVGGKTTAEFLSEQWPVIVGLNPQYVALSLPTNDLVNGGTVADAFAATTAIIQRILAAGMVPIWTPMHLRTFDATVTPKMVQCNALLREWAVTNPCGIFLDVFRPFVDLSGGQNASLGGSTYFYDSGNHLNNAGALLAGRYATTLPHGIDLPSSLKMAQESVSVSPGSNLLANPGFTGTGGTVGTGCAGTMPDSWELQWATRTGTATATAAIVNITDATTGLTVDRAIQVTISGSAANNDELRITQNHTLNALLASSVSTGSVISSEVAASIATGANIKRLASKLRTNFSEATWWGDNGQTPGVLSATIPELVMRTASMSVLGSGTATAADFDAVRVQFSGAGTGTVITLRAPRVRKSA